MSSDVRQMSFGSWFDTAVCINDSNMRASINGVDAVPVSRICVALGSLPDWAPRRHKLGRRLTNDKFTTEIVVNKFRACALRRGAEDDVRELVLHRVNDTPGGNRVSDAFTMHETCAVLWDDVAWHVDQFVRRALDPHFTEPKKKRHRSECDLQRKGVDIYWPRRDSDFENTAQFIMSGLQCCTDGFLDKTSVEDCAQIITDIVYSAVGARLNASLVHDHIAPICVNFAEPCVFLARTIVRSMIMQELIGDTLSKTLRRVDHCHMFGTLVGDNLSTPQLPPNDVGELIDELVNARAQISRMKLALHRGTNAADATADCGRSMIISSESRAEPWWIHSRQTVQAARHRHKCIDTVEFALTLNVAFKHAPDTLLAAYRIVDSWKDGSGGKRASVDCLQKLVSDRSMRRMVLDLDSALDLLAAHRVETARAAGLMRGFGFTTDESPPKATRFVGLRFRFHRSNGFDTC